LGPDEWPVTFDLEGGVGLKLGRGALTSRLTAVLRAAADGLPAGEAAQLTITRSDQVRWAAAAARVIRPYLAAVPYRE
jgi:hypothetical protein